MGLRVNLAEPRDGPTAAERQRSCRPGGMDRLGHLRGYRGVPLRRLRTGADDRRRDSARTAEHPADPRRRPWLRRPPRLQPGLTHPDPEPRPSGLRGRATARRPQSVVGVHPHPLRAPDRPLRLAFPAQEQRPRRPLYGIDRARAAHPARLSERERLRHRGHRQVASRAWRRPGSGRRRTRSDRLRSAAPAGSGDGRLRALLRHSGLARHGALPLHRGRRRVRGRDWNGRGQRHETSRRRRLLARRRDRTRFRLPAGHADPLPPRGRLHRRTGRNRRRPPVLPLPAPAVAPYSLDAARGMFALRYDESEGGNTGRRWKLVEGLGSGGFTEPRQLAPAPGGAAEPLAPPSP